MVDSLDSKSQEAVVEVLAIDGMLQARRDIIEQHCEGTHSRIIETLRLRQQNAQWSLGAKQKCLAGMKAVNKLRFCVDAPDYNALTL